MTETIGYLSVATLMLAVLSACGTGDSSATVEVAQDLRGPRSTAAVLRVLPGAFRPEARSQDPSDYRRRDSLTIPAALEPQGGYILFEGPVLENDRVAYRYYADERHRFDIFGKRVGDLVMDTVSWRYHDVADWGADILKVGNSLGFASPAILYADSLYTLSNARRVGTYLSEDASGDTAEVVTTFEGLTIGGASFDVEETWRLPAGTEAMDLSLAVTSGTLPVGARWATGLVKHPAASTATIDVTAAGATLLATWGEQSYHDEALGMAIAAPGASPQADAPYAPDTHLLLFPADQSSVHYRAAAYWERAVVPVESEADFLARARAME